MSAPADLQSLKIDRGPRKAARRRRGFPLVTVLVLVLLVGVVWVLWPGIQPLLDRMRLSAVRTLVIAETAAAAAAAVSGTAANGHVVAGRRAALSSDVPGRIVELRVKEGSVVKQGEIVARLYSEEWRAALERAQADLAAAEAAVTRSEDARQAAHAAAIEAKAAEETQSARVAEAKALQVWAGQEHQRMEELLQQGIRSSQDVQRARSELDATAARVAAVEAALRSAAAATSTATLKAKVAEGDVAVSRTGRDAAAAAVRQATAALDKMDVRAPFDGIVVLKDAEVGEVVSPNSQGGSNARGAVCTLVDFASLEIQANVAETSLPSVVVGAPVDCYLDVMPARRYPGVVDRIWPTADRQKATVEVRIKLLERDDLLRPELGARIVFRGEAAADAPVVAGKPVILVPDQALVLIRAQEGVFVVERDLVRFQVLTLGERRSGRAVVKAGLKPGERIVANPPASLQDGDRVRIEDS